MNPFQPLCQDYAASLRHGVAIARIALLSAAFTAVRPLPAAVPTAESAADRDNLPAYQVIAAATTSELTPALQASGPRTTWERSNSDSSNNRYSSLSQINRSNVNRLEVAWTYHSGDGRGNIQANPVIADGVMFVPTVGKHVVAIDAETGRELWRFTPPAAAGAVRINGQDLPPNAFYDLVQKKIVRLKDREAASQTLVSVGYGPAERGLTYWRGDKDHSARLFFLANGYLIAVDAKTGALDGNFGEGGMAPMFKGAGSSSFLGAVPPAIYRDVVVATNQNFVEAFSVSAGRRKWSFNTLRYAVADNAADNGGNVWGGIAMDTARGIAFVATGDPHPNFVGTGRIGKNDDTNSVIALDALSGRVLWRFQEVAHDLWDHDTPAPPLLVTVSRAGKRVDAVAEVTKFGNTLLLDRLTGKPLFPYRLRRAPVSDVPGERTWPYQPDLELPQPFARQVFGPKDITDLSPEAHAFVQDRVQKATFGWFEPPHVGRTLIYYGVHGGAEWTGAAFDPTDGMLYVSANELAWFVSLSKSAPSYRHDPSLPPEPGEAFFQQSCSVCHGENREGKGMAPSLNGLGNRLSRDQVASILKTGRNAMPPAPPMSDVQRHDLIRFLFDIDRAARRLAQDQGGASAETYEASGFDKLLDQEGYPGVKPPWGTLNAIDLNTGRLAWKVPLGEYPELTKRGVPKTGTENFGGAMATAGGLVFCAGTRDLNIRAFDKDTGEELWRHQLPFGGFAPPSTYEVRGRQYVVIPATGGGKLGGETGDAFVAFALPHTAAEDAIDKSIWRHDNLVAWCVVPFDANDRNSEQRASMLQEIGFQNFAYDWREKDVPTFDAEIEAMQKRGIKIVAWWFPFDAGDPEAKTTLETFKRHGIHPQLLVIQSLSQFQKAPEDLGKFLPSGFPVPRNEQEFAKLGDKDKVVFETVLNRLKKSDLNSHFPSTPAEQEARVSQEAERIAALAKLAAPYGCTIELYNHNGWFGREENELAIINKLAQSGQTSVGMVYNFSHSRDNLHDDSRNFPQLWALIKDHVVTVNITGMRFEGDEVYPSQGDSELEMMRTIQDSGWKGRIGVIAEKGGDAKVTLKKYITGIDWLAAELRQPGSGGPKPFPVAP